MKRITVVTTAVGLAWAVGAWTVGDTAVGAGTPPANDSAATESNRANWPATVDEARGRARILHETIHGALQVVHRDFFRDDQRLSIPSRSLEDVFRELARSWQVQVRWLAVNTDAMNVDHQPGDDFEKEAVKALAAGKSEFEAIEGNRYRFAGPIRLTFQCQKCHVPHRTGTADRAAGLAISMPMRNGG